MADPVVASPVGSPRPEGIVVGHASSSLTKGPGCGLVSQGPSAKAGSRQPPRRTGDRERRGRRGWPGQAGRSGRWIPARLRYSDSSGQRCRTSSYGKGRAPRANSRFFHSIVRTPSEQKCRRPPKRRFAGRHRRSGRRSMIRRTSVTPTAWPARTVDRCPPPRARPSAFGLRGQRRAAHRSSLPADRPDNCGTQGSRTLRWR